MTFKKAVDLTLAMEAAEKNAKVLKAVSDPTIQKLSTSGLPTKFLLSLWQRTRSSELLFQGVCCHWCGKLGHIAPVCHSAKKEQLSASSFSRQNKSGEVDEL